MNVNGIGAAGYMTAGYETKKTRRNMAGKEYADPISNAVQTTQMPSGTFELHISDDEGGKSIGAICGADYSLTVYQPKDFDPANPVYKVKVWDKSGNITERMVDISEVDERNSDYIDMFAYSTYLTASGQCPAAQSVFTRAVANPHGCDSRTYEDLFERTDWVRVLKEAMQTQYDAGNLKEYLDYKKFWDYLDNDAKQAVTGKERQTGKMEALAALYKEKYPHLVKSDGVAMGLAQAETAGQAVRTENGIMMLTQNGMRYMDDVNPSGSWAIMYPITDTHMHTEIMNAVTKEHIKGADIEDYTKWEKYFADKGLEYERVLSDEGFEVL